MNIRDIAINFEAVKVGVSQNDKGVTIRLLIHPNDLPPDLMTSPVGTRYVCALVETNDQSEPVQGTHAREGERRVQSAGMLCRNAEFVTWLGAMKEHEAAAILCDLCGIESRAELKTNVAAQRKFDGIVDSFKKAKNRTPFR